MEIKTQVNLSSSFGLGSFKHHLMSTFFTFNSHSSGYIISALSLAFNPPPWEAWRFINWHVDSGSMQSPLSRLAVNGYALLLPSSPTQKVLVSLLSISRASLDPKVVLENLCLLTRREIPLRLSVTHSKYLKLTIHC